MKIVARSQPTFARVREIKKPAASPGAAGQFRSSEFVFSVVLNGCAASLLQRPRRTGPSGRRSPRRVTGVAPADNIQFLGSQFTHCLEFTHRIDGIRHGHSLCSASPSVHAVPGMRDAGTHTVHKTLKKTEIFNSDESDSTSLMQATPLRSLGRATAGWSPPKRRTCRRIAKQSVPRQSSPLVGEGRVWGSRFVAHAPRNHKKENEARRLVFELRQLLCTPTTIAACPPRTGL